MGQEEQPAGRPVEEDDAPRPGIAEAGAGMVADVAVAGLRFIKGARPDPELERVLNTLEAHRGLGLGLSPGEPIYNADKIRGGPAEPRQAQQLHNAILDDILMIVNTKLESHEAEEAAALEKAAQGYTVGREKSTLARCISYDVRKLFLGLMMLLVMVALMWEVTLVAVDHELDCDTLNGKHGLGTCLDAREEVHVWGSSFQCSRYTCAAPWSPAPGNAPCTSCNCGAVCDACEQCICTYTPQGGSAQNLCHKKEKYTEGWGLAVRVVLLCIGGFVLCVGLTKWGLSAIINGREQSSIDEQKKIKHRFARRKKDLKQLKKDVLIHRIGGDAWKVEEPHTAFTRRMKVKLGEHDYQRLAASGGQRAKHHQVTLADEAVGMVGQMHDDIRDFTAKHAKSPSMVPLTSVPPSQASLSAREPQSRRESKEPARSKRAALDGASMLIDENEAQMMDECRAHYAAVQAELGGRVPNRRFLYNKLVSGQPPASSLMDFHIRELRRILERHPEVDKPVDANTFVSEWVEISDDVRAMEYEPPQTEEQPEEHGNGKLLGIVRSLGLTSGDDDESTESSSESDCEDGSGNPMVPFVKGVPHLLAMLRGAPPPSKEQAAQQRQGILAAMQGLQNLTGTAAARVEDIDSDSDQSQEPLMAHPA
eukprot:TRINITY_DN20816_c0_g1_i1.p1 TRINITY_DN20816_c0_g1~~TRINITY_DN20816_c0_g1_i1.p1  ORF type:complete len:668 (+),score=228.41 TRINITY_DN20816_c0_g1_i1:54-2006(+)